MNEEEKNQLILIDECLDNLKKLFDICKTKPNDMHMNHNMFNVEVATYHLTILKQSKWV